LSNIKEISLYISKSNIVDGKMYWSAVGSDVDWDLYGEKMTLELYKSMISKINNKVPPPEFYRDEVTSEYWQGGMPYLSIAHYSDGNGKAVPGEVHKLYIDGKKLKSKGVLFETPLGKAVWKSLKKDELNYKNLIDEDRIRISIAFIDLAHKHGENGRIFHRKSKTDVCPDCQSRKGEKIYLDGYLVHLALTRVPVNPRTLMEIDNPMAKKSKPETRKEDAESILGESSLVAEIVEATLETKSDVLVEMSEAEESLVEESKGEKKSVEEEDDEEKGEYKKMSLSDEDIERIALKVKSLIPEPTVVEASQRDALEVELDSLYSVVMEAKAQSTTPEEKLMVIQPALSQVAEVIKSVVKEASGAVQPTQPDANAQVMEAIQALTNKVDGVITEVATFKAQSVPSIENRVPVPRSVVVKSTPTEQVVQPVKSGSVKNIIRRSVGLS